LRWQHRDVPGPGLGPGRSKRPRPSWKPPTATSYGRLAPTGQPRTITQPRLRRGPAWCGPTPARSCRTSPG